MALLEVGGLSKRFGRSGRGRESVLAVDTVSFSLDWGRTLAIVGESGAGKSTVARMVLRLIEPDEGTISFDGIDVRALRAGQLRSLRPRMQCVFQDPYTSLDPRMSVGASVAEPLALQGVNRVDRERRAAGALARVGIGPEYLGRKPRELSGGQLQRVSIARAIISDPELIVCDEPVSALDVTIRAQVINLLLDLQDEKQLAYLFISHDLALVEAIAHDVMVMRRGCTIESGPASKVFTNPDADYTRALLAAVPGRAIARAQENSSSS
jgi:oligopeptide transport system ATP-binding protein